jgi:hypothetical protein
MPDPFVINVADAPARRHGRAGAWWAPAPDATIHYPVNEKAAEHGASTAEATDDAANRLHGLVGRLREHQAPVATALRPHRLRVLSGMG